MRGSKTSGFTLIELLIVVAIIGIIATIAIPNLLNALDRAKQKRTMADLRTVSSAIEHYSVDNTNYPMVNTIAGLQSALVPLYTESIPSEDGWSNTYVVDSVPFEYTIASGGKDGGAINVVGGETAYFDDAIIFANGQFYQWPAGKQQ